MALIFRTSVEGWAALAIPAPRTILRLAPFSIDAEDPACALPPDGVLLARIDAGRAWAALPAQGLSLLHNGVPVAAGLRVLAHRDALALEGAVPVYFSTEEAARIDAFAGEGAPTCPRCRSAIERGEPAVRCPGCGVFHHETGERNCWTYAPNCSVCAQPTPLDAGLQWTPDAL